MEYSSWNKELLIANLQFKRLFNNIQIEKDGKKVKFGCVIGNRSRIFKNMENPEKNSMPNLPLIIIQRTGITKNNERLANVNNEVKYRVSSKKLDYNLYTPVPVDISYQVTIVSKYQDHIDRAISNFIPFFNKDLFVRCEHPKFEGLTYTNQIIMEDSIDEDKPDELDPSTDDFVTCTCNFLFKTYIFSGVDTAQAKITTISTYVEVSSFVGPVTRVYELTDEDKKHLSDFVNMPLSTTITEEISTEVSNEVSVEIETPNNSGFLPQINRLYVGFYPVPLLSAYIPHMNWVDGLDQTVVPYPDPLSGPTTSAAYHPYVDRFTWDIAELGDIEEEISAVYY